MRKHPQCFLGKERNLHCHNWLRLRRARLKHNLRELKDNLRERWLLFPVAQIEQVHRVHYQ